MIDNAETENEATRVMSRTQYRSLLTVNCLGTKTVQHIWQTIGTEVGEESMRRTDKFTTTKIKEETGPTELEEDSEAQAYRPKRMAGLGYTSAMYIKDAAFLGGFALAAYGKYGIIEVIPELQEDVDNPNLSRLPAMKEVTKAWTRTVRTGTDKNDQRIRVMAKAAVMGLLKTGMERPEEGMSDADWNYVMQEHRDKEGARYEQAWKGEHITGTGGKGSSRIINKEMEEEARKIFMNNFRTNETNPQRQAEKFLRPHRWPGILKDLWEAGERKIQRLISRLQDMDRLQEAITNTPDLRTQARQRAMMNRMANIPLSVLPSQEGRRIGSEEYEWILNNRLDNQQAGAMEIGELNCKCGQLIGKGRHFRKCNISNGVMRIHDTMRDTMLNMVTSAGLTAYREPMNLLRDSDLERPADIFITNWRIEGIHLQRHAIDCSFPLVDSAWIHLSKAEQEKRATVTGWVANQKSLTKRNKVGSAQEQVARGNSATMQERCRLEGINYWPIPIEGDGACSTDFDAFLNNVSDAAEKIRGHDPKSFKARWIYILACKLADISAKVATRRSANERRRLGNVEDATDEICGHLIADIPLTVGSGGSSSRMYRNRTSDAYKQAALTKRGAR